MAVNAVVMSGRICSDLELKNANNKNSSPYIRFSIAVPRDYKDEDGEYPTDFFYCLAFGQDAKFLNEYGYKGRELTISGRLQQRKYEIKRVKKPKLLKLNVIQLLFMVSRKQKMEIRRVKALKKLNEVKINESLSRG